MANTLDADLYGTIVGNSSIEIMQDVLKPLGAFTTDFSDELGKRNEGIVVPMEVEPDAALDKTAGSNYTIQDADLSERTITLNRHKYTSWSLTDTDVSTSRALSIERFARSKGQKVAIAVWQDICCQG